MPPLLEHQSTNTTKLLLVGDSGSGKTGALASLAADGYNLRILDLDNGLDVLRNLLADPKSPYPKDSINRVEYRTITDKMKNVGGRQMPGQAKAWQEAVKMLDQWKYEYDKVDGAKGTVDLGPITSWTGQDILVIDSLSMLSTAALNFILQMNGRLGQKPFQSDWGDGQMLVEGLLQKLYDDNVKCNIIVNCHITFIEIEGGQTRGYPNALGKALPPKIARYFNSTLMIQSKGAGTAQKRKILTNTTGIIDLKNTAPLRVAAEYNIETGLAEYFKAVRS